MAELAKNQSSLAEFEKVFVDLLDSAALVSSTGKVLAINVAASRLLNRSRRQCIGRRLDELISADFDRVQEVFRLLKTGQSAKLELGPTDKPDEKFLAVTVNADTFGKGYHLLVFHDLTVHQQLQAEFEFLAHHDPLTELPNRHILEEQIKNTIKVAAPDNQLAVLFIDLDSFKEINDRFGHHFGDFALVAAAQRLRGALRPSDLLVRFGGDEFVVLCGQLQDSATAIQVAQRMTKALSGAFTFEGIQFSVQPSIGISLATKPNVSAAMLLRAADLAMYEAKRHSEVNYFVYSERLDEQAAKTLRYSNIDGSQTAKKDSFSGRRYSGSWARRFSFIHKL